MIEILDNFFPLSLHDSLIEVAETNCNFVFHRSDGNGDLYLTHEVCIGLAPVKFTHKCFNEAWDYTKEVLGVSDENLNSSYINLTAYGMEAHPHRDFEHDNFITVICYLSGCWNICWGGETVFYDKKFVRDFSHENFYTAEIIKSVLPKQNRVAIFQGNIMHSVRPLSKSFKGKRITLMFKVSNVNVSEVEANIAAFKGGRS